MANTNYINIDRSPGLTRETQIYNHGETRVLSTCESLNCGLRSLKYIQAFEDIRIDCKR